MRILKAAAVAISLFTLAGCSSKPPSCSDKNTIDLVNKIFFENIEKRIEGFGADPSELMPQIKSNIDLQVSNIRTEGYEKEAKKHSCAADIVINIKPSESSEKGFKKLRAAQKVAMNPMAFNEYVRQAVARELNLSDIPDLVGVEFGNSSVSDSIKYTSTFAEDPNEGKRHYVSVAGISSLLNSVVVLAASGSFKQEENINPSAVSTAAAPNSYPASDPDACFDQKVKAFRAENGEDSIIQNDIIEEWNAECKGQSK